MPKDVPELNPEEEFNVEKELAPLVQMIATTMVDNAIQNALLLHLAGMTERQAASLIANYMVTTAWRLAAVERIKTGNDPSEERFLSMAADVLEKNPAEKLEANDAG